MAELLVSVRSAAEAESALAGCAQVIDVKEPSRGPLGRADDATMATVLARVAGRRPVSAALGELNGTPPSAPVGGLRFVKCGLAGWQRRDWQTLLARALDNALGPGQATQLVIAAYADWAEAEAPPLSAVCAFACRRPGNVLLIDTLQKTPGMTLLSWLSPGGLTEIAEVCRAARVRLALAGSLGPREIIQLRAVRPDWFV